MENWLFLELQDIEEKEEQRKAERRRRQVPGKCVGQAGEGKREGGTLGTKGKLIWLGVGCQTWR